MKKLSVLWTSFVLASPAYALDLSVDPLIEGDRVSFEVSGAPPFATVLVVRSGRAPSQGATCPPVLGGRCLDLLDPTLVAEIVTDATGAGSVQRRLPAELVSRDVWFQAIGRAGGAPSAVLTRRTLQDCSNDGVAGWYTDRPASLATLRDCGRVRAPVYWLPVGVTLPTLPYLIHAEGALYISPTATQTALEGPPNLRTAGSIVVGGGAAVQQITGFAALESVLSVHLADLPALQSVSLFDGSVQVGEVSLSTMTGLSDLSLISGLVELGSLTVEQAPLTDLTGLPSMRGDHYALRLRHLPALSSLDGLPPTSFGASVELEDLPSLDDLSPLQVHPAFAELAVRDQPGLTDLAAIQGVALLDRVELSDLPNLATLEHLRDGLQSGAFFPGGEGQLVLQRLPSLGSLFGLEPILGAEQLELRELPLITALAPLSLLEVHGDLTIVDNAALSDVSALSSLTEVRELTVLRNPSLCEDDLDAALLGASISRRTVSDNGQCP